MAVNNSPMAAAATIAMVIDSSMVMRRSRMFSNASWKIGQPAKASAPTPTIQLTGVLGSNHRMTMASAATMMRAMAMRSNGG